jgi:hypothetical protein
MRRHLKSGQGGGRALVTAQPCDGGHRVNLAGDILSVIDLRSFSSIWYWIVLAVTWSTASHWVLGVPYDIIQRARRQGGQAQQDLYDILRVNVTRLIYFADEAGPWAIGLLLFLLTILATLALWYRVELAQAVLFLALPMTIVGLLSVRTARRMMNLSPEGDALYRMLQRHRMAVQAVGMAAIFVTAMYGMWHNLDVTAF